MQGQRDGRIARKVYMSTIDPGLESRLWLAGPELLGQQHRPPIQKLNISKRCPWQDRASY